MISNLKLAREHAKLTQKGVASASGYSLGQIRNWEQGVSEPDAEALVKLAGLYKCSTDAILGSWAADLSTIGVFVEHEIKLDSKEIELVELFRKITDEQRDAIMALIRSLIP